VTVDRIVASRRKWAGIYSVAVAAGQVRAFVITVISATCHYTGVMRPCFLQYVARSRLGYMYS